MTINEKIIQNLVFRYVDLARLELQERWTVWNIDLSQNEMNEVIGGLLSRQVSLATRMALNPGIWNNHMAPIVLRCMVDVYINFAWIIKDPIERSRKFIKYGLGQLKLEIEHRKAQLEKDNKNPQDDLIVKDNESLLNSQRFDFLTEVNLGNWAELNTRKMAEEANCIDFYNYAYTPFSAAVHSTWRHICVFNLKLCSNPLHMQHRIPFDPDLLADPDYWDLAAKYLAQTFELFDNTFNCKVNSISAFQFLQEEFGKIDKTTNN